MNVTISVNGRDLQVPEASSVLDAINASGDYISQLCKDADMKQIGACRTCLVEIEGANGFPASCSVPVRDGMRVWTDTSGSGRSPPRRAGADDGHGPRQRKRCTGDHWAT